MIKEILLFMGGGFLTLSLVFVKYKWTKNKDLREERKHDRRIRKELKARYKRDQELEKQHEEIKQNTAQNVADVTKSHDARKDDMSDLFHKGG